jgi:type II secretion system protein I
MRRTEAAFMMIEAVVATVILAVGLMGVFSAIHAGMEVGEVSRESGMAAEVAQSKMSEIELSPAIGMNEGTVAVGERSYGWQTNVTQTKDAEMLAAQVTVTYQVRGTQRQIDLATLIYRRSGTAQ